MLARVRQWGEFVTFTHTGFALSFALASMAVAARGQKGWPGWRTFGLILLALVCACTCAMTFNRIIDRANPRTAARLLPAGRLLLAGAWTLWAVSALGLMAASFDLNPLCFYLSPVALFVVCFCSVTKRFTDFTHVFLGAALALAPLGAWLAVRGSLALWPLPQSMLLPLILGLALVFGLIGFDMIYALQDYEHDRQHGLHSLVVRWGPSNALKASFLAHVLMWGLLVVFGLLSRFRVAYFVGLVIILGSLVLEHWLARKRAPKWIHRAFARLNALIGVVLVIVVVIEVVFPGFRVRR